MKKDFINEIEVIFQDEKIFGDNEEHYYDVMCYDGYGIGISSDGFSTPKEIKITYPKLSEILEDKDRTNYILKYRGLHDLNERDIHYGDIMMAFGKIIS